MKGNIIKILIEIIDLLNQTKWIKQAEWYKLKLELLIKTDESSYEFDCLLKEIDSSISGMGSFSDLPMKREFREIQWDLSAKIVDAIRLYFHS